MWKSESPVSQLSVAIFTAPRNQIQPQKSFIYQKMSGKGVNPWHPPPGCPNAWYIYIYGRRSEPPEGGSPSVMFASYDHILRNLNNVEFSYVCFWCIFQRGPLNNEAFSCDDIDILHRIYWYTFAKLKLIGPAKTQLRFPFHGVYSDALS